MRALLLLACLFAGSALAAFPSRPVTIVVPQAPGGANDVLARIFAQKLQEQWGQPVVIDFRPGAGDIVATQFVARSAPDGQTIGLVTSAHALNPTLAKHLPYDTLKDFAAVARLGQNVIGLVVMPSLHVDDVKGLIALAKAHPGELSHGSNGIGSAAHLAAELFKSMAGVNMVHVPYKGGAPLYNDMLGGRILISFAILNSAMPYVKQGKMKVLAVTNLTRSKVYPEYPPISDTLPGYELTTWSGFVVPAATPRDVVQKIADDVIRSARAEDVQRKLADFGYEVDPLGPAEFEEFIRAEIERKGKLVRASNARFE